MTPKRSSKFGSKINFADRAKTNIELEARLADKHCTVIKRLVFGWREQPNAAPGFGGRSIQRPINAQATLRSTLPKCWQTNNFYYGAEFRIKFQLVFNFDI